jgi:pyroglutamyl-peptidase
MRILITAFGPFGDCLKNPSESVLNELAQRKLDSLYNASIDWQVLPVSFSSIDIFLEELGNDYDLILHMGVAMGESALRFEMIGQNIKGGTDIDGKTHTGESIVEGQRDIATRFPESLLTQINNEFPDSTMFSSNAGTYLCNYVYFKSLLRNGETIPTLFIHVADSYNQPNAPTISEQADILQEIIVRYLKIS